MVWSTVGVIYVVMVHDPDGCGEHPSMACETEAEAKKLVEQLKTGNKTLWGYVQIPLIKVKH